MKPRKQFCCYLIACNHSCTELVPKTISWSLVERLTIANYFVCHKFVSKLNLHVIWFCWRLHAHFERFINSTFDSKLKAWTQCPHKNCLASVIQENSFAFSCLHRCSCPAYPLLVSKGSWVSFASQPANKSMRTHLKRDGNEKMKN